MWGGKGDGGGWYSYYGSPYQAYGGGGGGRVEESSGGCCSARWAAAWVGLVELLFVSSVVAIYVYFYLQLESAASAPIVSGLVVGGVSGSAGVVLVATLLAGLCRRSSALLLPHLIAQIVAICLMTAIGALVLLATFVGVDFDPGLGSLFPTVALAIGILCLGMGLAEVWFFFIVRDAYHLFRAAENRQLKQAAAIHAARLAFQAQSSLSPPLLSPPLPTPSHLSDKAAMEAYEKAAAAAATQQQRNPEESPQPPSTPEAQPKLPANGLPTLLDLVSLLAHCRNNFQARVRRKRSNRPSPCDF